MPAIDLPVPGQPPQWGAQLNVAIQAINEAFENLPEDVSDITTDFGFSLAQTFGSGTLVTAFGAVGDGVADDSPALNAAIAAAPEYGMVVLPKGTYRLATPVTFNRLNVSMCGPGRINGKLIVGANGSVRDFQGQSIRGVQFTRGGTSTDPTNCCIELRNVMNLLIDGNSFRSAGAAIYTTTEYDTARNTIVNNLYHDVGYFFRSVTGATPSGRDPALQWRSLADMHFINNIGQALVDNFSIDSGDGNEFIGNTLFQSGYQNQSAIKGRNIRIGYSDWTVIQGNNLFEAGLESIALVDPGHTTISANNIAWPGQRVPSDAISITFATRTFGYGNIGGGVVSQATKNIVGFYGSGAIELRGFVVNHIAIERSIGTPPAQYYGAAALPTPYRVYMDSTISGPMPILPAGPNHIFGLNMPDNHRGRLITEERWLSGTIKEQTLFARTVTVNAGAPTNNLYELRSADGSGNVHFAGIVNIYFTPSGTTTKSALYQLIIGKTPNTVVTCTLMASSGNTTGAAADDPSFTFDVFNSSGTYYLRITRVGSTSGAFGYTAWATGPLQLQ